MTRRKIYVAGSSRELDRAARFIEQLTLRGHEVTSTWVDDIRAAGRANEGYTRLERLGINARCMRQVKDADALVALLPPRGIPGDGLMTELSFAHQLAAWGLMDIYIVGDLERSTFLTRPGVSAYFEADEQALRAL